MVQITSLAVFATLFTSFVASAPIAIRAHKCEDASSAAASATDSAAATSATAVDNAATGGAAATGSFTLLEYVRFLPGAGRPDYLL